MNPRFMASERMVLFIDGPSLYFTARNLGLEVDYANLLKFFSSRSNLVRAFYNSPLIETDEYSPLKPLTDWLAYNGFSLVTKPTREFTDASGRRRVRGNMEVDLAVDMMELSPRLDHAVLFSGNSEFSRPVEAVQRQGVRVTVISSVQTQPPAVADELRRQADQFVELRAVANEFARRVA